MHNFSNSINDLSAGLKSLRVSFFFALSDIKARYRRSIIGPFWQTLGAVIGVVGLGLVWSQMFQVDMREFIPSLAIGLIVWQWIAGVIVESCSVFVRQVSIIKNLVQPLSIHPINQVLRQFVNFAHSFAVYVILAIVLQVQLNWNTLLVIPGLLLLGINLLWMSFAFGVLGTRFRDLEYGLTTFMPVLFLISPVMFRLEYLPISPWILELNPITYLIEIVRAPLLGQAPPLRYYAVMIGMAALGWALAFFLLHRAKLRLPFWI